MATWTFGELWAEMCRSIKAQQPLKEGPCLQQQLDKIKIKCQESGIFPPDSTAKPNMHQKFIEMTENSDMEHKELVKELNSDRSLVKRKLQNAVKDAELQKILHLRVLGAYVIVRRSYDIRERNAMKAAAKGKEPTVQPTDKKPKSSTELLYPTLRPTAPPLPYAPVTQAPLVKVVSGILDLKRLNSEKTDNESESDIDLPPDTSTESAPSECGSESSEHPSQKTQRIRRPQSNVNQSTPKTRHTDLPEFRELPTSPTPPDFDLREVRRQDEIRLREEGRRQGEREEKEWCDEYDQLTKFENQLRRMEELTKYRLELQSEERKKKVRDWQAGEDREEAQSAERGRDTKGRAADSHTHSMTHAIGTQAATYNTDSPDSGDEEFDCTFKGKLIFEEPKPKQNPRLPSSATPVCTRQQNKQNQQQRERLEDCNTFQFPLVQAHALQEPHYEPWKMRDMLLLKDQLPPLRDGGAPWLRAFERLTQGMDLAMGDLRAIVAACSSQGDMERIDLQANTGLIRDSQPFGPQRRKWGDALRDVFPLGQTNDMLLQFEPTPAETPEEFLKRTKDLWTDHTGQHPANDKSQVLFKLAVIKGLPGPVQDKLADVPGLDAMGLAQWEVQIRHYLRRHQQTIKKKEEDSLDLKHRLVKMQLREVEDKTNQFKKAGGKQPAKQCPQLTEHLPQAAQPSVAPVQPQQPLPIAPQPTQWYPPQMVPHQAYYGPPPPQRPPQWGGPRLPWRGGSRGGRGRGGMGRGGGYTPVICYICGQPGHWSRTCPMIYGPHTGHPPPQQQAPQGYAVPNPHVVPHQMWMQHGEQQ